MSKRTNLLLLKDVEKLGRSGDIVTVRSGFARNFLLPQKMAMTASPAAMRLQAELQTKRAELAAREREEALGFAARINEQTFVTSRKVDEEGHMYGSVTQHDIVELLEQSGYHVERKQVALAHPIKETGVHTITLKLKEGVTCAFHLKVLPEGKTEEEAFGVAGAAVAAKEEKAAVKKERKPRKKKAETAAKTAVAEAAAEE